jgi:hypothetical protein
LENPDLSALLGNKQAATAIARGNHRDRGIQLAIADHLQFELGESSLRCARKEREQADQAITAITNG